MECEWCGFNYPKGIMDSTFYTVNLFGKYDHIICEDCYKHLKKNKGDVNGYN
jgi:hypothetical protein